MAFKLHLTPSIMQDLCFGFLLTSLPYIQYFNVCQSFDEDPFIQMWMVERCFIEQETVHHGKVIPLMHISHAAKLKSQYMGRKQIMQSHYICLKSVILTSILTIT